MLTLIKARDLSLMEAEFPRVAFRFYASEDQPFISCILCEFRSADDVVSEWEKIQNFVSVYYQPETDTERWNIYLLLICSEDVDIRNKYVIQNDTYTARKIVVKVESDSLQEVEALELVNSELAGFDLKIDEGDLAVECNYSSKISSMLEGMPLDGSANARSLRAEKIKILLSSIGQA